MEHELSVTEYISLDTGKTLWQVRCENCHAFANFRYHHHGDGCGMREAWKIGSRVIRKLYPGCDKSIHKNLGWYQLWSSLAKRKYYMHTELVLTKRYYKAMPYMAK